MCKEFSEIYVISLWKEKKLCGVVVVDNLLCDLFSGQRGLVKKLRVTDWAPFCRTLVRSHFSRIALVAEDISFQVVESSHWATVPQYLVTHWLQVVVNPVGVLKLDSQNDNATRKTQQVVQLFLSSVQEVEAVVVHSVTSFSFVELYVDMFAQKKTSFQSRAVAAWGSSEVTLETCPLLHPHSEVIGMVRNCCVVHPCSVPLSDFCVHHLTCKRISRRPIHDFHLEIRVDHQSFTENRGLVAWKPRVPWNCVRDVNTTKIFPFNFDVIHSWESDNPRSSDPLGCQIESVGYCQELHVFGWISELSVELSAEGPAMFFSLHVRLAFIHELDPGDLGFLALQVLQVTSFDAESLLLFQIIRLVFHVEFIRDHKLGVGSLRADLTWPGAVVDCDYLLFFDLVAFGHELSLHAPIVTKLVRFEVGVVVELVLRVQLAEEVFAVVE